MIAWLATALAMDPTLLHERLEAVAELRVQRLSDSHPTLPADAYATAAAGAVATGVHKVEGHSARIGWGVGVFDAPIDAVWASLNDELHHGDLTPLSHVELVSGSPCADGRKVLMVLPLPLVADRFWVNTNRYAQAVSDASEGQVRELVWESVRDPAAESLSEAGRTATEGLVPLGFNKGAWFLVALDASHTLAEYHSWVDPGGHIPAGPASSLANRGIADTFDAMARYTASGKSHCR